MSEIEIMAQASYCHPDLIHAIRRLPKHRDIVQGNEKGCNTRAMRKVTLETTAAYQQRQQLFSKVQAMQAMQRACWSRVLSPEITRIILSKTSPYNVTMMTASCPLLQESVNAAKPIQFETSKWSNMQVAAGHKHTVCISADMQVFAWGDNKHSQLGSVLDDLLPNGEPVANCRTEAPILVAGLSGKIVLQVTAGDSHTVCVVADGSAYSWGSNCYGQLALGDCVNKIVPNLVEGELQGKRVQVSAGYRHTVFLADGLVYTAGGKHFGQHGVGGRRRSSPTLVTGELQGQEVAQIAAGYTMIACVTSKGRLFSWGLGTRGQLGLGTTSQKVCPTLIRGELEGRKVKQVAAGGVHALCVTTDGLLFSWGSNRQGQLGVGDTTARLVPTLVTGALQAKVVLQVSAGGSHTACVTNDGFMFVFGSNEYCQLGILEHKDILLPKMIQGQQSPNFEAWPSFKPSAAKAVVQVALGDAHTICRTADDSTYTWGNADNGQLGTTRPGSAIITCEEVDDDARIVNADR